MPKITHLIVGLGKGGAETMLYNILLKGDIKNSEQKVISMGASEYYEPFIEELGVKLIKVNIAKKPISSIAKINKEIRNTDFLVCWMYHANLIGFILGRINGVKNIIWNIRHTNIEYLKSSTKVIAKMLARRSNKVTATLFNGYNSRKSHVELGFNEKNSFIMNNGCDLQVYKFYPESRKNILDELEIESNKKIILSVAKYSEIKDIPTFVKAIVEVKKSVPNVVAVMCGVGISEDNSALVELMNRNCLEINRDVKLLGERHDLPILFSAADVYVLHSKGEAFPNTLIQAMACESACIATDVGDVRRILKEYICEAEDYESMAELIKNLLNSRNEDLKKIGNTNRKIIETNFDINEIVKAYEKRWTYEHIEN